MTLRFFQLVGITGPDYTKPYATDDYPQIFIIPLKSGYYMNSCLTHVVYMQNLLLTLFCHHVAKNVAKAINNYNCSFFYNSFPTSFLEK